MGFEVCECSGLWVSCGSSTVVVVVIFWVVVDLFIYLFIFKMPLVDVSLC